MPSSRIVVVSGDPVGPTMAGPAIRALELARVLGGAGHDARLAAPTGSDLVVSPVPMSTWSDRDDLARAVHDADVVVVFAPVLADHMWLAELCIPLVVDAYDPGLLETLEARRGDPLNAQRDWVADASRHLLAPLAVADVVLVASDRQRHLVLGLLAASGRLGPRIVAEDPTLEGLVRIVPFGVSEAPLPEGPSPLRGPEGPFGADAFVALWGGGLYPWLDPVALVEAVAATSDRSVAAVFLAGPHPTPAVGEMPLVEVARRRADELGLSGDRVVFVDRWVPYDRRGSWLVGADVGVSLHRRHVETELSFRTRMLDYLWAGLPIVCTGGDVLADLVAADDLGVVVEPGDVNGIAAALDRLAATDPSEREVRRRRAAAAADRLTWARTAEPLLEACSQPRLAADRRVAEPQARGPVAALRRAVRVARSREG
jgi:glycosyltransferase involved in cell wall biosynthesis